MGTRLPTVAVTGLLLALAGSASHARVAHGAPAWDGSQGVYVTGSADQLTIWRMRDGKAAEATVHHLVPEWRFVSIPPIYETRTKQVEVAPGRFEVQSEAVLVEQGHMAWRRTSVPFVWTRTIKAGVPKPRPAAGGAACGGGACGGGGRACGGK